MSLSRYVNDQIDRNKEEIIATVVSDPRIEIVGGQETWVADIDVGNGEEILFSVPIAQYAADLRHSDFGTPVKLQKDPSGNYQIVGRADLQKSNMVLNVYSILLESLLYTEGLWFSGGASEEAKSKTGGGHTGSGQVDNSVALPPLVNQFDSTSTDTVNVIVDGESERTEGFNISRRTYGELTPYGALPYGAVKIERI